MHFKTILRRKETNGFGDKAVLALQAQCASLTSAEQNITQREFTGMKITSRESLSSYLHHFLVAQDNAETAGNEYSNDALVDLFLSSLGTDNTACYSILCTTLENQRADGQKNPFADMELKFINRRKVRSSNSSGDGKPIVCFSCNKPGHKNLNVLKARRGIRPMLVQQEDARLQWRPKKLIMQAWCN
jgi:hypothetical protein